MNSTQLSHVVGLDLGKRSDSSALVVLEVRDVPWTPKAEGSTTFEAAAVHRWPLGTPYPVIVEQTMQLLARPQLRHPLLVVDQTGVGEAVVDLFRAADAPMLGVSIGGGEAAPHRRADGTWRVTKHDLVSSPLALLNYRRLTFAKGMHLVDVLVKELEAFRVKITKAANQTYGHEGGAHDDIVLALSLACWAAERACGAVPDVQKDEAATEVSRAPDGVFMR